MQAAVRRLLVGDGARKLSARRLALLAAVPVASGGACYWAYSRYVAADRARAPTYEELLQQKLGKIKLSSNEHTAKWRIYTDRGKDLFSQGRLAEAERYLMQALEEAKAGFGEEDFHVASSCNNLAELYRTQKDYDKARPLYLRAVELLEQELGPEHPSVGFALHNVGGFYLLQNDYDNAIRYYERALKIKGRGLGLNHPEYANTLFHLGKVKQLLGDLDDAEVLVRQAVGILEEGGFGQSPTAIRKMTALSEILVQSNQLQEAENLARKILHTIELSEGPEGGNTVKATENLANILHLRGNLDEAEELYKRCLGIRQKAAVTGNDLQLWTPLFGLACITLDRAERLAADNCRVEALTECDKAEALLQQANKIAEENWDAAPASSRLPQLLALAQSLNALGKLGLKRLELKGPAVDESVREAEAGLRQCLAILRREGTAGDAVAKEQLKCTWSLANLLEKRRAGGSEVRQLRNEAASMQSRMKA